MEEFLLKNTDFHRQGAPADVPLFPSGEQTAKTPAYINEKHTSIIISEVQLHPDRSS